MPAFRPRLRAAAVGISAFALVAIAAGGTVAASNPTTLYACYDMYGNVRLSDKNMCQLPGGGAARQLGQRRTDAATRVTDSRITPTLRFGRRA